MTTDCELTDAMIDAAAFRAAWREVFGPRRMVTGTPRRPVDASAGLAASRRAALARSPAVGRGGWPVGEDEGPDEEGVAP